MSSLIFATTLIYFTRFSRSKWYKAPAIVVFSLMCVSQAYVTYFYPAAPWLYPFVFVIGATLLLKLDVIKSLAFSIVTCSGIVPVLESANVIDFGSLLSAMAVTLITVAIIRSSYLFEITNFLLNKQNTAQQEANMELQREFSDRIRSFIPSVIAARIQEQVNHNHVSVNEASLNVLQPRKQVVTCLFSDIRGFTQGSKDLDSFITESVLPEVRAASSKIEQNQGIPRKIGDLIFAYYDDSIVLTNVLRALLSGMELSKLNQDMNDTVSSVEIKRFILISTGEAIVGNLGGTESSVEITALGSPVNFLSRLDDATKDPKIAPMLNTGDIVLCDRTTSILTEFTRGELDFRRIDLKELGVEIRDFPETQFISVLRPTTQSLEICRSLI